MYYVGKSTEKGCNYTFEQSSVMKLSHPDVNTRLSGVTFHSVVNHHYTYSYITNSLWNASLFFCYARFFKTNMKGGGCKISEDECSLVTVSKADNDQWRLISIDE